MTLTAILNKELSSKKFSSFSDIIIALDNLGFDVVGREGYSLGVLYREESYKSPIVLDFVLGKGGKFELKGNKLKECDLVKRYEKEILEGMALSESKSSVIHLSNTIQITDKKKLASQITQIYSKMNTLDKFLSMIRSEIENLPKEELASAISIWNSAIEDITLTNKSLEKEDYMLQGFENEPEEPEGEDTEDSEEDPESSEEEEKE